MNDHSLPTFWIACVLAGMAVTVALYTMKPARGEQAPPQIKSIEIELKRDRRRSPKFLKLKKPKEQGNGRPSETSR